MQASVTASSMGDLGTGPSNLPYPVGEAFVNFAVAHNIPCRAILPPEHSG